MNNYLRDKIINSLNAKLPEKVYTCPACGRNDTMGISTGLIINVLHENNLDILRFGPLAIPTIPIICNNCGYVAQHAVAVFLDDWEKFKKEYEQQEATPEKSE